MAAKKNTKKSHSKKNSGKKLWPWLLVVVLLAVGVVGGFVFIQYQEYQALLAKQEAEQKAAEDAALAAQMSQLLDVETFYEGIVVDGIELGGLTLDEARARLQEQLDESIKDAQVTVTLDDNSKTFTADQMTVTTDMDEILTEAMNMGREGELDERYQYVLGLKEKPVELTTTVEVDAAPLEAAVRALAESWTEPAVEPVVTGFDPDSKNKFTVEEGKDGRSVNADKLWELVKAEVDNKTYGTVEAPVEVLKATQTVDDILSMNTLITRFETKMTNDKNRITNIKLACSSISGTVLQPGQEFSFNKVVGERTAKRGYKEAGVIVAGMADTGLGGGICQVSGTLFNAVVRADLEIVKRLRHSYALSYLGPGTDATVDYPGKDFIFKNNKDTPVYIIMYTDGLKVIAEIYGVPLENGVTVDLVVDIISKTKPGARVTVEDKSIPVGEEKKVSGHTGYKLNAYRVYYDKDGNEINRVLLHKDNYPVIQPKLLINPKTTETTTTKATTTTAAPEPEEPETTTTTTTTATEAETTTSAEESID